MSRRMQGWLLCGLLAVGLWLMSGGSAQAQIPQLDRFYYYPFHTFPHNYWPQALPPGPERPGDHYQLPPVYMAYPPFHEPNWRYDLHERKSYYRGFHFWLDAF